MVDVLPADDVLTETEVLADPGAGYSTAKIAMIDVRGVIVDAAPRGLITDGENPVARFVEAVRTAGEDDRVKAVLIYINSPGGAVTATELIYREVQHFREATDKPVVVLMGEVAASGGYYLACAADHIVAHPSTVTGSIGVIMQTADISEGLGMIGVRTDAITSGPNKAIASPLSPMSVEQRTILQGIVDDFYQQFVSVVKQARPSLSEDDIQRVTDGRVVTASQALDAGLIDETGDLRDAFARTKELAGLSSARLVKYHRPTQYVGSAYARAPEAPAVVNGVQINIADLVDLGQTGFYYLWDPRVW